MASTLSAVSKSAQRLRNAAPEEWERFKQVFAEYSAQVTDAVTEADAGQIMTAKGHAQQCKALLRTFVECDREPKPTP